MLIDQHRAKGEIQSVLHAEKKGDWKFHHLLLMRVAREEERERNSRKEWFSMYKLSYILENSNQFNWSDALFLPEDEVWNKETEGMVLDPDDVEDDVVDLPKEAIDNNLMYVLSMQMIQSIVKSAKEQRTEVSEEDLVEAFLFYYDNDAYI